MKSKLGFLTKISLDRKIKSKWFLVANIIIAVAVIGLINVDNIIKFFGGDFDNIQKVYVIDETDDSYDIFVDQIKAVDVSLNGEEAENYQLILSDKDKSEAKDIIEEEKDVWVLVFERDESDMMKVTLVTEAYIGTTDYQAIQTAVNNTKSIIAINDSGISQEEINEIYAPVEIVREYLDEDKTSEDEGMEMIMTAVFPIIILPFFMLTIFLVQMIGGEINDEKTTRGMEIIISNVSPKTHFFSKVIAGNLFVLIQGVLLVVFAGLGILIRSLLSGGGSSLGGFDLGSLFGSFDMGAVLGKIGYVIPFVLILMILTFIAYSLLAGILASMTTNMEDFQQLQTPIMIISLVGYYFAMMAGVFDGAIFIRVLSYVPFISAILSPSLLMLGQIGLIDFLVSIALMGGTIFILVKYGLRIYKVGILNYSSKDLWKKMFKAAKEK